MTSSPAPFVSIVIVSWNSGKYLPRCLESLSQQTFRDFEVILVDNGSSDNSLEHLEERYPGLGMRVERLPHNLGFAGGNNLGARLARGQWLVLLNTDAFPEPDWLAELVKAAQTSPGFGSFSSRQLRAGDPNTLDGAGDAYHVSGLAWRIGLGYPSARFGLESAVIFSPCAAAAMYLRQAFLEVGGFDEDFFSYFEDVDLGFRLQLAGYRCLYVAQAVVHHVGSATLGERSDFAFYHAHRNLVWTYIKDMPSTLFWLYLPAHLIANVVYVTHYALRGRGRVLLRAKWDAILGLPAVLRKRKITQKTRKVSNAALGKAMEHGWLKPYLLGYHLRRTLQES